jgi:hypothetical protein
MLRPAEEMQVCIQTYYNKLLPTRPGDKLRLSLEATWQSLPLLLTSTFFTTLSQAAPYCTLLHLTAQYCTLLHLTAPYCTSLHLTAPYCTCLHFYFIN